MTLYIRDRRGAVSLRYRNRAEIIVLMCVNRSPIWYGFRADAKAIRYNMNTYLTRDCPLQKSAWSSFAVLQKSRRNYRSYVWTEALGFRVGAKAIQYNMNTYLTRDCPIQKSARSSFAPLQKSRQNHRSYVCEQKPNPVLCSSRRRSYSV